MPRSAPAVRPGHEGAGANDSNTFGVVDTLDANRWLVVGDPD